MSTEFDDLLCVASIGIDGGDDVAVKIPFNLLKERCGEEDIVVASRRNERIQMHVLEHIAERQIEASSDEDPLFRDFAEGLWQTGENSERVLAAMRLACPEKFDALPENVRNAPTEDWFARFEAGK